MQTNVIVVCDHSENKNLHLNTNQSIHTIVAHLIAQN